MKSNLNIVFFGTPDFAMPVLKALLDNECHVSGIFSGQGAVSNIAKEYGIKLFQPTSLKKDEQAFEAFKILNPNLCIVAAYGKIIPTRYLEIPKHGFINIHPSLLPKYRGPSPIQTAILNGDKETGVTLMAVDKEMDHGPILKSVKYQIPNTKYNQEISKELFELGAKLLLETLPAYLNKELEPKEQNHKKAVFTKILERKDGKINWKEPARKILNRIRALNPEPGTWTTWEGKTLNIIKAEETITNLDSKPRPGTVVNIQKSIAVKTGTCYLNLLSIQLEGGKTMDAKSFLNGHPDFMSSVLE